MASIAIYDLKVAGLSLFEDQESYLADINDFELGTLNGGIGPTIITASSPECVTFAAGFIVGVGGGIYAALKLF
ncbi:hypothetical protein [Moorena producens]|nr:hypothetical protein [Moorena producens]